ncbi:hypothetical protein [Brevibacterium aurantiacum]|uniref:Uncharacterized protein n=1 Tax=Brevibacterium aurantiacum TaxID=273384 RepID=A0A556C3C1_BREAU|nr:hypothetical protein [Brevibacterium aurantiacum]TSI11955.1 hypothetical protein FO013_21160 [Brevibacterium aurantiacum]
MNALPGNPHHYEAHMDAPNGYYQVAQATLALAFEQRTANIIAMAAQCTANGRKELGHPFIEEAGERLGFGAES